MSTHPDLERALEALVRICDKRSYRDNFELVFLAHEEGGEKLRVTLTVGDFRALLREHAAPGPVVQSDDLEPITAFQVTVLQTGASPVQPPGPVDGLLPWHWQVNEKDHHVTLFDSHHNIVMDFVRWGMGSAAPRFNVGGIMRRVEELAAIVPGREHHASWFKDIDHPVARLIAMAPVRRAAPSSDALRGIANILRDLLGATADRCDLPQWRTAEIAYHGLIGKKPKLLRGEKNAGSER